MKDKKPLILSQEDINFLVNTAKAITKDPLLGYWMRYEYSDNSSTKYNSYCLICNVMYNHNYQWKEANYFTIEHGVYHLKHKAFL